MTKEMKQKKQKQKDKKKKKKHHREEQQRRHRQHGSLLRDAASLRCTRRTLEHAVRRAPHRPRTRQTRLLRARQVRAD